MPTKCRDSNPPLGGVLYARGSYSEGGSYMPVDTVSVRHAVRWKASSGWKKIDGAMDVLVLVED
jgi:hypothetical protein